MDMATSNVELGWQARRTYLAEIDRSLDGLADRLSRHLLARISNNGAREQEGSRRAAYGWFQQQRSLWLGSTRGALTELSHRFEQARGIRPHADPPQHGVDLMVSDANSLVDQVMASRAALAVLEQAGTDFRDLSENLRQLEGLDELNPEDLLHPIQVARAMVEGWTSAGLSRELWLDCQVDLHQELALAALAGYRAASEWLVAARDLSGLMPLLPLRASAPPPKPAESDEAAPLLEFLSESLPMAVAWLQSRPGEPLTEEDLPPGPAPAPSSRRSPKGSSAPRAPTAAAAIDWTSLARGAAHVRAQVSALKTWSPTTQERTVIELVSLMFDAILSADRIPANLRLSLAKLQMPVLRTALADPTFLSSSRHPARLLIDRMGAAVLGFEAAAPPDLLEQEVRHIVQVVEQYPDSGQQVFAAMLKDFERFLSQHPRPEPVLPEGAAVAQQVEQQHILTVQYTIELRKLMGDQEVRPVVREFLFQIWAEVMAHANLRYGEDDARVLQIRQAAQDLLWAARGRTTRQERAQVIARVPGLMESLRQGMALIGYSADHTEAEIKLLRVALVDAFMSGNRPQGA
jgi:Protein of unknown function (DUF1631)